MGRASEALGLAPRTLQRRLDNEGTSFREVFEAELSRIACAALDNAATTVSAVAESLGYASRASFHRAFVGWHGKTPAQWRDPVA